MENSKKILLRLPELFLIGLIIFYWFYTATLLNPIAIGLILSLIFQATIKNRFFGIAISSILIIAGFYMLLALMSELNKFTTFNSNAKKLLIIGLPYFLLIIITSGIMIYKCSNKVTK